MTSLSALSRVKVTVTGARGAIGLDLATAPTPGQFVVFDAERKVRSASGTGADAGLRTDLAAPTGGALVGFRQTDEARVRSSGSKVSDIGISFRDAPSFIDADVDNLAAVQWAIDRCFAFNPKMPAPLDLAGFPRIDVGPGKSLMINQPSDGSEARFTIASRGRGAGFRVVGDGNLFDTTLPFNGTDPCSERVNFRDVAFMAESADQAAQTFAAGKFLRMTFDNCEWERLTCMGTTTYAQSWDFMNLCRARGWKGIWFEAAGAYAINAEMECKFGDSAWRLVGPRGITQSSFMKGTYEGLTGSAFTLAGCAGVAIAGGYIEFNGAPGIRLDAGIPNTAVSIFGIAFTQAAAQLSDPDFFDVVWGQTRRGQSFGNRCNGRLHDTTGVTGISNFVDINDSAGIELYKGYKAGLMDQSRAAVGNVFSVDAGIVAMASGQAYSGFDSLGPVWGPGEVQSGAYVPIRQVYGTDNPQTNPGLYGNPLWTRGSVVRNASATGEGQVREWVCTASGQPGTWRAQVMQ